MKKILYIAILSVFIGTTCFANDWHFKGDIGAGIPYGVFGVQGTISNDYFGINGHLGIPVIETGDNIQPRGYGLIFYPEKIFGYKSNGYRSYVGIYYGATTLLSIAGNSYYFWQHSISYGAEWKLDDNWFLDLQLLYAFSRTKSGQNLPSGFKLALGTGWVLF